MGDKLQVEMDGVTLKESREKSEVLLKWSLQVKNLTSKLKARLTGLDKLKYVMSKSSKKNIVEGVFNSVLCYCLPLFWGWKRAELKQLQVQQNRAAQIVLN